MLVAAGLEAKRGRPFEGDGVVLRILPFMAAAVLAYALTPLVPGASDPGNLIAGAMIPVLLAWALLTPWERLPAWVQALPPLFALVAAALVRDAQGGMEAPFTPVVLLPVFWFALYGTRQQMRNWPMISPVPFRLA